METPFQNTHTQSDMKQLKRLLSRLTAKKNGQDPVSLLNLACGRADETGVLADVYGKNGIHITGMDIRDRELEMAKELWAKHLPSNAEAEFHVQNGTQLDLLKQLDDDFDVIFMRHQNYWNGDTTWQQIYDQALHRLDKDGQLVITSYFDREHQLALKAIQALGAELVVDVKNNNSRLISEAHGKSVDRHIAVFRKP
ncbi:MAG: class I SAM-dependent methyltransferase [Akkermansiaceae bacterium]